MGGQRHAPEALPSAKTRYPLYRRLGGPQGWYGRVRKISPPTGIRSSDRPARSQSLYRLSYPAHCESWVGTKKAMPPKPAALWTCIEIQMLHSKIENAHWEEKLTTTRCDIRETVTTRNCVLWLFLNNHNALWHERNCHKAKCLLNELFILFVIYW